MTSHRTISLKLTLLTLLAVLMTVAPASACASPLLSGYGGPGEGNQAILGSALLGGGGSSGGGARSTGFSPGTAPGTGQSAGESSQAGIGQSNRPSSGSGGLAPPAGRNGRSASGAAGAYPASSVGRTSRLASVGSETLGLSGEDLLYILFALGVLTFVGVLTRRLTLATRPEGA